MVILGIDGLAVRRRHTFCSHWARLVDVMIFYTGHVRPRRCGVLSHGCDWLTMSWSVDQGKQSVIQTKRDCQYEVVDECSLKRDAHRIALNHRSEIALSSAFSRNSVLRRTLSRSHRDSSLEWHQCVARWAAPIEVDSNLRRTCHARITHGR